MLARHRFLILILLIGIPSAFGSESRGRELFALCASCHGPEAQGNPGIGAPAIAGLPSWYITGQLKNFIDGARGKNPDDDAGNRMRAMARTLKGPNDPELVAAYIASLPPAPTLHTVSGNADRGKPYSVVCMSCHGPQGDGNQAIGAPPLHSTSDWYLVHQLKNFKARIRGYDRVHDPKGAMIMAPITATLPNEQAMDDVITYIQSMSKKVKTP